jgi:two-component system, OmpR family, sensor kinase
MSARLRPWRHVRGRLLLIVLVALALGLAAATYGFNVIFTHTTSRNADSLLRARASSELSLIQLRNGRLTTLETKDDALADSQVWIFGPQGVVESPRRPSSADERAATLTAGPARFLDVPATDVRLYATPIVIDGVRRGTLVTGISLAPYKQTQRTALIWSLALAGVLLVFVGAAVFLLLRSALRPVSRMTQQASSWSELELDRRFGLGEPHDELTQLGATLDALLDRIAASLRHERRFSAEVSHELRTPLARLIGEAELALRRERTADDYRTALEFVLSNAQQVARIVDALVTAAQHEAATRHGTVDAYAVVEKTIDDVAEVANGRGLDFVTERPRQPVRVGVDSDLAERVLHPVIDNACRYGSSEVHVSVERRGGRIVFVVEDDGPGLADGEAETIFLPGARGEAGRQSPGAGLGLALARRLARSVSGDVAAETNGGGARFVVSLPAA